ncbi:MAG: GldG family protein [Deltaproteobacteria bacterium]|nr:GldG family protein [Deltaproteobacteria bacterium]
MEKTNRTMTLFRLKASSNMTVAILLILVLAVAVTLLSDRHYFRWDVTASGEHTLSDKTLQALKTIQEPVKAIAFVKEPSEEASNVKKLLASYEYHLKGLSFEMVDPDRNPALTRQYDIKALNTLILEGFGQSQTVKTPDEESLTNALVRLSKGRTEKVYWVMGHGERPFKSTAQESLASIHQNLSNQNYEFEELTLAQKDIPSDAALVVVAAPEKNLFPEEVASLKRFLNKGGSLLIFLEPYQDGGLKEFLREYGVVMSSDMVVDKMSRVMGGDFLLPMIVTYGNHEITKNFRLLSFFSLARSVEVDKGVKKKGLTLTNLALTSQESWSETDRDALNQGKARLDAEDRQGPLSLAVIVELDPKEAKGEEGKEEDKITGEGKLAVFGDADFASNKFVSLAGNSELMINTMNYLVGRKDLITIPEKERPADHLMLSRNQGLMLFWIPVVGIPLLVIVLGVVVWRKRRSR